MCGRMTLLKYSEMLELLTKIRIAPQPALFPGNKNIFITIPKPHNRLNPTAFSHKTTWV